MKNLIISLFILSFGISLQAESLYGFLKDFNQPTEDCSNLRIYNTGKSVGGRIIFKAKQDGRNIKLVLDEDELTVFRGVATVDRFAESVGENFRERLELRKNSDGVPEAVVYSKFDTNSISSEPKLKLVCNY